MDETVLHVELTQGDVVALLNAADRIYSFIGYAQGAEARYQMRRDQIVVALPFAKKKPWRTLGRRRDARNKRARSYRFLLRKRARNLKKTGNLNLPKRSIPKCLMRSGK